MLSTPPIHQTQPDVESGDRTVRSARRRRALARGAVLTMALALMSWLFGASPAQATVTPLRGSITLTWNVPGDNDLWIIGHGVTTNYRNPNTTAGTLTADDTSGRGPERFTPAAGKAGPFTIRVQCFANCVGSVARVTAVIGNRRVDFGSHTMTTNQGFWNVGTINFSPTAAPAPAPDAAGECWQSNEQFVVATFQVLFGRDPSTEEKNTYVSYLEWNASVTYGRYRADYAIEEVIGDLQDFSQEYADLNKSDAEKITDLFRAALHREPTADELQGYLDKIGPNYDYWDAFTEFFVSGGEWTGTLYRLCSAAEVRVLPPTYTVGS